MLFTNMDHGIDSFSPNIFPWSNIYTNILFVRKNSIDAPELDIEHYSWIIWYVWKAKNDKLYRRIDKDPLKVIIYAGGECQAWFSTSAPADNVHETSILTNQTLNLENICLVDDYWISTSIFSGCRWVGIMFLDKTNWWDKKPTTKRIWYTLKNRSAYISNGKHTAIFHVPTH